MNDQIKSNGLFDRAREVYAKETNLQKALENKKRDDNYDRFLERVVKRATEIFEIQVKDIQMLDDLSDESGATIRIGDDLLWAPRGMSIGFNLIHLCPEGHKILSPMISNLYGLGKHLEPLVSRKWRNSCTRCRDEQHKARLKEQATIPNTWQDNLAEAIQDAIAEAMEDI